ncbi:MAG: hypothetical protein TREMPRED_006073, partial [Tremellales sp. Tagirdzhanova-0007]
MSSPDYTRPAFIDEMAPLLPVSRSHPQTDDIGQAVKRRGLWSSIFRGELGEHDDKRGFAAAWRRFWLPVGDGNYWKAMVHLCFINFPFALLVWPPLVAGTLAGTALLITLPIGAAIWWLVLIISRSAAHFETFIQVKYHSPLEQRLLPPIYHPIFHRIKDRSNLPSPISEVAEMPEIQWEKRFIKCSYAMFSDHYSYSALQYFLLVKPLIVLFSTILLIALLP